MKREDMFKWNAKTTGEHGVQVAIAPGKQECEYSHVNRVNLDAGEQYTLESGEYEMFAALISGAAYVTVEGRFDEEMKKLDCFYLSGEQKCRITAK